MASHEQNLLLKGKTLNTFKTSLSTTVAAITLFFATSITFILVFRTSPPPKSTYHSLYLSASDNETVSRHLFSLTRRPHVAGSEANADVAAYILSTLSSYGLRTRSVSYAVSLSYPSSRSLTLFFPPHPPISFSLIQEVYPGDPYADVASEVIPTFHAYAKSGSAEARVAYANYGRVEDYAALDEMGVNVSGTVVLARYGKIYRGDIVLNAYERGAIGVVVYTDAKDYGGGRGGSWFPEGPGMPPSGVQVGSVDKVVGDPTTPGWASTGGCERISDEEVEKSCGVPLIPSLPVSSADGETIMRTIGGKVAPDDWQGATGAPVYRLGPGPGILNLTYNGTQRITEIQNVFGVIEGAEEPDRYVLLGNHHDAWTFGAGDPNSGTATMLEVARRFEKLKKRGWKPRRTIVLCNWDAEEFHLIGSTEWVEENRELLASRVVAYLNIDSAVYGPRFRASSTPQLDKLIKHVTQQVQDPNEPSKTVYESWTGSEEFPVIERLGGGGSDFAAFIQHVGVPSLDISFEGEFSVYHSLFDDFIWMHKFGDPMFQRHVAAASIWGLLTLKLADEVFLPFDYLQYAFELHRSTTELEEELLGKRINLGPLYKSIEEFKDASTEINVQRKALESNGLQSIWSNNQLKVRELNDRLMMAERAFADRDGLSDRSWYKHLIYGPPKHNGYESKSFPGIVDAIENAKRLNTIESWKSVQHEVWRDSRAVTYVALVLNESSSSRQNIKHPEDIVNYDTCFGHSRHRHFRHLHPRLHHFLTTQISLPFALSFSIRNATICRHLLVLTRRPHVAGSQANGDVASYILSTLSSYGLRTRSVSYAVSLSYPSFRSLTLSLPPHPPISFSLIQEVYPGDPYADVASEVIPTFHAYAKSGSAEASVAYANYGRVEDYAALDEMGVNVSGTVVLARYGKIYRGDIVLNAYERGAIGVVVYTDAKDYGGSGGGGSWFPEGVGMPPTGVQVGSVNKVCGDPTTPGWASTGGCERMSDEEVDESGGVPLIPSLPVSSADGEAIMRTIGGEVAPDEWQGRSGGPLYRVGPGPGILNLTYNGFQRITAIQNVFGVIEGVEEPDRYVLLGNHHDAWAFGAVDPGSGTATMLEVARRLSKLRKRGWKPRRTIVLCSWDAEEYHLIGSAEWVEENRELLASRVVAYLNIDIAASGPRFGASATPQLDKLLKYVTQQVQHPDDSTKTVYESWTGSEDSPMIGRLGGGGSDFAGFVQHVGVPAVDISFRGEYPVYHSLYDDFIWMKKFGDPMFKRHVAAANIWGLLALKLADEVFLPFDYLQYASELHRSTLELEAEILGKPINLAPLYKSIEELKKAATEINVQRKELESKVWQSMRGNDQLKVRELNDRLMMAERAFTDRDGLFDRPWYKHLIYGPPKHNTYGSKSFPGIDDAIEKAKSLNTTVSWKSVQHEVWRVSRAVTHVSLVLDGKLT